jgi:hypothetical protein
MITIVIKKSPAIRLFDRMPLPKPKVRHLVFPRRELRGAVRSTARLPFSVKVSRII